MKPLILLLLIVLLLTGCGSAKPPTELAPDGKIVEKAIAVQFQQTQQGLSDQLTTSLPDWKITNIRVTKLEPLYLGKLPTYHLQGTYKVTLKLPEQEVKQPQNEFDIYVQRQREGKTWRLIKHKQEDDNEQWFSYSLEAW